MCALFRWLDVKKIVPHKVLKRLTQELANAAEERGTDASGISYIKNGKVTIYKRPKPAHKLKFSFPEETRAVMGHTRLTTQGNQKFNWNNHPFLGHADKYFAFAHNGVLYNDGQLRKEKKLPPTCIKTDSYVTGKSTLARVLKYIVGETRTSSVPLEKMDNNFAISQLRNARLNIAGEISRSVKPQQLKTFKELSGGDSVYVDVKFEQPLSTIITAKHLFLGNFLPVLPYDDDSLNDRLNIIFFDNTIPRDNELETLSKQQLFREVKLSYPKTSRGRVYINNERPQATYGIKFKNTPP